MTLSPAPLVIDLVDIDNSSIVGFIPKAPPYGAMHLHQFYQLDIFLGGNVLFNVEGKRPHRPSPGTAILTPPLLRHSYKSSQGFRHACLKFFLSPQHQEMFGRTFRVFQVSRDLIKQIEWAERRRLKNRPLDIQHIRALITLCLIEAVDQAGETQNPPSDPLDTFRISLWPLLDRISKDPLAVWNIQQMAKQTHLSPDHFTRCFRKVLNTTPRAFLVEARIRAISTQLLTSPFLSIKKAADLAGFSSVHSFSHSFKRTLSYSPAAFRRKFTKS